MVSSYSGNWLAHETDHVPGEDGLVGIGEPMGLATGNIMRGDHRPHAGDSQRADASIPRMIAVG